MTCNKCGSHLEGEYTFCPYCGAAINNNRLKTEIQVPAQPQKVSPQSQTVYTQYQNAEQHQKADLIGRLNDPRGMKWFKFIIYFWIFANGAGLVLEGLLVINGLYFDGGAGAVYSQFGNFKALDIIVGLICIALGGASFYVRQRLAKFRANGPKLFMLLLAASLVVDLLYIIIASQMITGAPLFLMTGDTAAQLLGAFIFLIINYYYLKKRADLFVN